MTYHLVEYLQISEFPENQYCIVLRWIEKNRILPVWIDAADAFELLQHEAGVPTRRPRMVNVLIDLAAATAGGFKEVHIDSYFAGDYIASLVTNNGDELECRPSDAMGVAYLLNLPIMASEDVLSHASVFISEADLETWLGLYLTTDPGESHLEESASGDAAADADFSKLMESMGVSEADLLGSDDNPPKDSKE